MLFSKTLSKKKCIQKKYDHMHSMGGKGGRDRQGDRL